MSMSLEVPRGEGQSNGMESKAKAKAKAKARSSPPSSPACFFGRISTGIWPDMVSISAAKQVRPQRHLARFPRGLLKAY